MSATLEQSLLFGRTNRVNEYYKLNSDILRETVNKIKTALEKDMIQEIMDEYMGDRASLYPWGSFYLFRNHPMLLGLITQHFLGSLHKSGVSLGGDQGAIMTAIHLYNLAQQSTHRPQILQWTDLEKVIEWQDPSWIFLGDRPENVDATFRHLSLVMGISSQALARDRRGRPTYRFRNNHLPYAQKKNRKLRLMSKYVDLGCDSTTSTRTGAVRWVATRASEEPLVMLEMFVAKALEKNAESTEQANTHGNKKDAFRTVKVHPLRMISIFKDGLKSEEKILRFDLLALNQRCVELLRKVQAVCIQQSPVDYPYDDYGGDWEISNCVHHMIAGVLGLPRQQPTRFLEACAMFKDAIEAEGAAEYEKAELRCFIEGDGTKKVVDKCETPIADLIPVDERAKFNMGHN